MRALFAIFLALILLKGIVEGLFVDVLRMFRQMIADALREIGNFGVWHEINSLFLNDINIDLWKFFLKDHPTTQGITN